MSSIKYSKEEKCINPLVSQPSTFFHRNESTKNIIVGDFATRLQQEPNVTNEDRVLGLRSLSSRTYDSDAHRSAFPPQSHSHALPASAAGAAAVPVTRAWARPRARGRNRRLAPLRTVPRRPRDEGSTSKRSTHAVPERWRPRRPARTCGGERGTGYGLRRTCHVGRDQGDRAVRWIEGIDLDVLEAQNGQNPLFSSTKGQHLSSSKITVKTVPLAKAAIIFGDKLRTVCHLLQSESITFFFRRFHLFFYILSIESCGQSMNHFRKSTSSHLNTINHIYFYFWFSYY